MRPRDLQRKQRDTTRAVDQHLCPTCTWPSMTNADQAVGPAQSCVLACTTDSVCGSRCRTSSATCWSARQLGTRHPQCSFELSVSNHRVDLIEGGWNITIRSDALADSSACHAPARPPVGERFCSARVSRTSWPSGQRRGAADGQAGVRRRRTARPMAFRFTRCGRRHARCRAACTC